MIAAIRILGAFALRSSALQIQTMKPIFQDMGFQYIGQHGGCGNSKGNIVRGGGSKRVENEGECEDWAKEQMKKYDKVYGLGYSPPRSYDSLKTWFCSIYVGNYDGKFPDNDGPAT